MYASIHIRDKFDPSDEFCHYPHVELDEDAEADSDMQVHVHFTSNIYLTFHKDEWNHVVEKVNEVTFGKW